jgi:hypothetical protein
MADHNVTLNYGPDGFHPDLDPIPVKQGQTIAFKLGQAPSGARIRLIFRDRHFFATSHPEFAQSGVFHQGDGDVRIVAALPGPTTYHCELRDANGGLIAQSLENAGGGMIPDA